MYTGFSVLLEGMIWLPSRDGDSPNPIKQKLLRKTEKVPYAEFPLVMPSSPNRRDCLLDHRCGLRYCEQPAPGGDASFGLVR